MSAPINKKNAIEAMAFVVAFEHPFSPETCESLLGLQEILSEDFPTFNRTMSVAINIKDDKKIEQSESLNGVLMQKTSESGHPEWQLRAQGNTIIASCFYYDRWNVEFEKAVSYLLKMASSVDEDNPATLVALQTVDKFMDALDTYHIGGVFNTDSRYLTKHALESGRLWHVYQGWFEEGAEGLRYLNVLNLSSKDIPDGVSTTIDHNAQAIFDSGKSVLNLTSELSDIFEVLHNKNKVVVRELLNEQQKTRIGL